MNKVVFLLEELSMKELLDGLLPRIFPGLVFQCIAHEGKRDLEKSIPRKLRAWREPGVKFVVLRDNDGGDCVRLKQKLMEICEQGGRADTLVRIVCQELEAWYLGEPAALAEAFDNEKRRSMGLRARFRDPDRIQHPVNDLKKLVPEFQKISGARKMARFLSKKRNTSTSFRVLLSGVDKLRAKL